MQSIRLAKHEDTSDILAIYAPFIHNTTTTFETEVPTVDEMSQRVQKYLKKGPWLVMDEGDVISGYAYASEHRSRAAYQWSIELSVYVHPDFRGRGIASRLYRCALEILKTQGYCTVLAGVTQPNDVSNAFHTSIGFSYVGNYHNVGFKYGKWCDVKWYEYFIVENQQNPLPIVDLHKLEDEGQLDTILRGHNEG